ncbi:hypothetical protein HHI36_019405 [Cryptolaemus montrouzieri]|uniref:Major facilitator superfamily (MFS) profile domain-containing protein n=1 Tax=Cryptolaemus montrouzieri TaxID=559131 RepID=A0ABD2P2Y3_9CUCU
MKLKILQTIPLQSFYMSTQQCKLTGCGQAIQYVATFFCSFNVINSGLEYGWTSASFPILMKLRSFEITSEEGVWIATLPLPGAIIGSITNAVTCDIFGRKNMILFSCLPFTIHWILLAFANAAFVVYIARFLAGFASGVVLSAIPMYIGEISNAKIRGMLCGIAPLCIAFGVFLTNLMHLFLSITAASLLALVFPIGCFIGLIFMPESPYFYLMKNKEEKALRSMKIFSGSEYSESDFIRIKTLLKNRIARKKKA